MAKLVLSDLVNLQNESSAVNTINNNSALIEAAIEDTLSRSGTSPNEMNANLDMNANRILNLPLPVAEQEPVRKGEFDAWTAQAAALDAAVLAAQAAQSAAEAAEANAETSESNAATSESNAATSESNAATSESNAATSESNAATSENNAAASESNASTSAGTATTQAGIATTQAGIATTQAGNASTSATNANNSAIAAAASAQDAEDALDEFDDIYLGSKTSDPTLDNDGDPLVAGQLYWNSVASNLRIYDGASWNVYSASTGLTSVVDDTNPALGGNLDLNGHVITGLEIGTNVQAQSSNLDSWSMKVPSDYLTTTAAASAYQPLASTLTSLASASANGVSLVTAADYAAMRGLLDLEAGTDFLSPSAIAAAYQALSNRLTDIAGLAVTDGNIIVGNGTTWVAESGAVAQKSLGVREVLTADRTYYVRTDGSDSNSGLANTSGGAFLTIGKATAVAGALDCSIYNVTIEVGAGTFNEVVNLRAMLGSGTFTLTGAGVSSTTIKSVRLGVRSSWSFGGFTLSGDPTVLLLLQSYSAGAMKNPVTFAGGATDQIHVGSGARLSVEANYTISGGASRHWRCDEPGGVLFAYGRTITLTGTPAFSNLFALFAYGSMGIVGAMTFTGAATGARYYVASNAIIQTGGGGSSYLPGNAAGSVDTGSGGIYV